MVKRILLIVILLVAVVQCAEGDAATSITSAAIDELFRAYQEKLPEPQTVSECNGAALTCPHHGYATYTLLQGIAERTLIKNDADLLTVIPWCRNADPCVRQIALNCVRSRIGYNETPLSVPCMHQLDHFQFYDILVAAKTFLDSKHIKYEAKVFGDTLLDATPEQFAALVNGMWAQDGSPMSFNFLDTLVVENGKTITVTTKPTRSDPTWPDRTWSGTIKEVRINEKLQYVLRGDWDAQPAGLDVSTQKTFPYNVRIWMVTKDVLWLSRSDKESWRKFTKTQ